MKIEKMVCINNTNVDESEGKGLIIGKIYDCRSYTTSLFSAWYDGRFMGIYHYSRFLTLKEYRMQKLIKLNEYEI